MDNTIQPGTGYTLTSSSKGITLNIDQALVDYSGISDEIPPFPDVTVPAFPDLLWPDTAPPQQFEVQTLTVDGNQYVRIACGAVNYTQSNMPEVKLIATTDTRQAWISRVAVAPGITVISGSDPDSPWMENGGYYQLPTAGNYFVTISKMDIKASATDSALLQTEVPFVSIFAEGSSADTYIFSETGPSLYVNQTNIQKMSGYDAATTGLDGDFGNCHTTFFNPVKWGYSVKLIATIASSTPAVTEPTVSVLHAATETSNEVHRITLPAISDLKKAGSFKLQYDPGFFSSTTTDFFDPFDPLNSGNLSGQFSWNLGNALKAIEGLRGNATVTAPAPDKLDITYLNTLSNTAVPLPTIIENSLGVPTQTYLAEQHVVGSIDLSIPVLFNGSTLMNVADWVASDSDPYLLNEEAAWGNISNFATKDALEALSAVTTDYFAPIIGPADWTSENPTYLVPGSCTGSPTSDHPFKVVYAGEVEGESTYTVVTGTVNNAIPVNIDDTLTVTGAGYVWLEIPYDSTNKVFPKADEVIIASGTTLPDSDADYSYVALASVDGGTVNQLITGSLWGDRIQLGSGSTASAQYYYAKV